MDELKLLVVGGGLEQDQYELTLPAIIGRSRETSLQLTHPLVSRRHCELLFEDGRLVVRDLGSLNGTFIGRERILEQELRPGDLLTVGPVTFRAAYGDLPETESVDVHDGDTAPVSEAGSAGETVVANTQQSAAETRTEGSGAETPVRRGQTQPEETLRVDPSSQQTVAGPHPRRARDGVTER